jgi:hypothetical protein
MSVAGVAFGLSLEFSYLWLLHAILQAQEPLQKSPEHGKALVLKGLHLLAGRWKAAI